ncbi:hypothetical protein [Oerskovia flava]|uniref:hypothetical protein n=1 Tax=Oerskovia flava TaxID=2986422 RepID=UPI00224038EF|nr:hypothetical protein [Oerskovia sp. JB1-3-2]
MSRTSEVSTHVYELLDRGRDAGMTWRESDLWAERLPDPCGCAGGAAGAVLGAGTTAVVARACGVRGRVALVLAGTVVGGVAGKLAGLGREQAEHDATLTVLEQRVHELERARTA